MFSGIIEFSKPLQAFSPQGILSLLCPFEKIEAGESIAVNGVCLTAQTETLRNQPLTFYVSPETLKVTNLSTLKVGDFVNLERALTLNQRISGHIVQGHVDAQAEVLELSPEGQAYFLKVRIPPEFDKYLVSKGSLALNGVSLTINGIDGNIANFMVIPHTWTHTNLSQVKVGSLLNFEVDVLAKHLEKLCTPYLKS